MTEAEQFRLTRWGIPGWTAILSAFCFAIIDIALTPPDAPNPLCSSIQTLLNSTSATWAALAAVLATAGGVPLGFCIYQAYFWLRWNSPVSRDGFLPPPVVGRQDDLDRTIRGLTLKDIDRASPWRRDWVKHPLYLLDHGFRWRYMENLFTEAAQEIDSQLRGVSVFARHRSLLDLMHTLGATLAGTYLGYLVYLLAKAKLQSAPLTGNLILTGFVLAVLLVLLAREDAAKNALEPGPRTQSAPKSHERAPRADSGPSNDRVAIRIHTFRLRRGLNISIRVSHPSVMFLIVVFSLLFAGTPSPYNPAPPNPHLLRLAVAPVLVAAWFMAKWKGPRDILVTETLLLAVSITVAYLVGLSRWVAAQPLDWPFFWSVLAFVLANLAFLKNRENARDDVIALEYYTLRRFLTDGEAHGRLPSRSPAPSDSGATTGCS